MPGTRSARGSILRLKTCLTVRTWAHPACAVRRNSKPSAVISTFILCAATSIRACENWNEFLNDSAARASTTCERALLSRLGGGCQVPIGAFAEIRDGILHLEAVVADPDGSKVLRESRDGEVNDPEKLGSKVGEILLSRGGDEILEAVYGRGLAMPPPP